MSQKENPSGERSAQPLSDHLDTLILGDCCRVMRQLPDDSIDLVLTDPPYLVNYRSRDGRTIAGDTDDAWLLPAFSEAFRVLKSGRFCISFYGWSKADRYLKAWREAGFRPVGHLVWTKPYASGSGFLEYRHEQAYLLAKGRVGRPRSLIGDVQNCKYTGNRLHPMQKPVSAFKRVIEAFSFPGEVVLDPFCGSGSVLIAAELSGRRYIGIEVREDYFEITRKRLKGDNVLLKEENKRRQ